VFGQNNELRVHGHLAALGTPTNPITFTSRSGAPTGWNGLVFDGGTGHLRYATVRGGGYPNSFNLPSNVTARNSRLRIENSAIRDGASQYSTGRDYGLYVENSQVVVSDTLFANNGDNGGEWSYMDYTLYATGAGSAVTVTGCTFQGNAGYPVYVPPALVQAVTGNSFSGNTWPRILVAGGSTAPGAAWSAQSGLAGYDLAGHVVVPAGLTLTIEAGLHVFGQNNELRVHGHLAALGTPTNPITFTSRSGAPTGWNGLVFDGGTGHLRYATVRGGGYPNSFNLPSNVTARNSRLRIENSAIRDGASQYSTGRDYGLYVENSQVVVSDTLFANNGNNGGEWSYMDYALYATGASSAVTATGSTFRNNSGVGISAAGGARVVARHSGFHDNTSYAFVNSGGTLPDARYNWWGQDPPNAGDFSGGVPYTPWIVTSTFAAGYFKLADDIYEPNDTLAQAGLEGINTELSAFLNPPGDVDVYRLDIEEAGALLALANASGTPLALRVSLYDVQGTLLAAFSGAVGAVVTATAAVSPGITYVGVSGLGNAGNASSHLPYLLTLARADLRADLVAETTAQAGRTYDFGSSSVDLAPGGHATLNASAPPSLTVPGGYYLVGALHNGHGQALAESLSTFFISDSPLALTLHTDQAAYRPGQSVLVAGEIHNTGASSSGPHTLTLAQDGIPFHTQSVSLGAHSSRPFTATTSAPGATGQFTLTAQVSDTIVSASVPVAEPEIEVTLDAPEIRLAGAGAWEATLSLANRGPVATRLDVDFHGQGHTLTLSAGALAVLTRTLDLTQTTTLNVAIAGDPSPGSGQAVSRTLSHLVIVNAAPALSLNPAEVQHEGDVEIPYRLVNPGTVDLVAQVEFQITNSKLQIADAVANPQSQTLAPAARFASAGVANPPTTLRTSGKSQILQRQGIAWVTPQQYAIYQSPEHSEVGRSTPYSNVRSAAEWNAIRNPHAKRAITVTHILPAGGALSVTDTLVLSLTRGLQVVPATLRVDAAHNPGLFSHGSAGWWEQATAVSLTVKGDNDLRLAASGAPTVTAVITNAGWNAFSGTLRTLGQREATFSLSEQPIHVPLDAARAYTATVDTEGLASGPYTITLEVWTDDGVLVATTALAGSVPAPDFVVTHLPTHTTLGGNQETTLAFGVENRGAAPDLAAFHLALGDLKDEIQQQWIPVGATGWFTFSVYAPLDMPTMDVMGVYSVTSPLDPGGEAGDLVLHVDGITLDVSAATDQATYAEGEPFTFSLGITNAGERATDALTALVAFNGITQTRAFSLTAGQAIALQFTGTATFAGDRQLFYGIYGAQSDRGAYLNTYYLYRQNPGVTLALDRQVYAPGATARATLATTLTQGTLTAYAFGTVYTSAVSNGASFSFTIPASAERGSHALYYSLQASGSAADGREYAVWFDVAAPWARVTAARLGALPSTPGSAVTATLTIASDTAMDARVWAWLRYPDGSQGAPAAFPAHLSATLNNQLGISVVVTDAQMGLYQLLYQLEAPVTRLRAASEQVTQADGSESFDLGPAGLAQVITEQDVYPNSDEAVRVLLEIYSPAGGTAQATLTLDASPVTSQSITLLPGYQSLPITLTGPLPGGERTLYAGLHMQGYYAKGQTTFDYGASLPNLRPGAPAVASGGLISRTVTALVNNAGQSASTATTARFYDGDPAQGGLLIGTAPVPALPAGETTALGLAWDIQAKGGAHTLYVAVEPVSEWDTTDNTAQAAVTLPRLDSGLALAPASIAPGGTVTFSTRLRNLQGAAALAAAFTLTVRSPTGTVVHVQAQALTLDAGQERLLDASWASAVTAQPGVYTVLQEATTAYGERELASATFIVAVSAQREWRLYLPLVLRSQ
jgi:hypothetical protein